LACREGGLSVRAQILGVRRGSTIAKSVMGMGIGADHVDVAVEVRDASGQRLLAFTVQGEAVDERYRDLHDVLSEDVPRKIREQLRTASR